MNIRRYFSQLPSAIREELLKMAVNRDFSFVDVIGDGVKALEKPPASREHNYIQENADFASELPVLSGRMQTGDNGQLRSQARNSTSKPSSPSSSEEGMTVVESSLPQCIVSATNIYSHNLRIGRISYFAAIFANASCLGFDFSQYLVEESISPFFMSEPTEDSSRSVACQRSRFVPKDLRPLPIQKTKSHHPYLVSHSLAH